MLTPISALSIVALDLRGDLQARTHLYEYFKQVTRRKHRFGEKHDMSFTSLSSADHKGDACSDDYGLKGLVESDSQADFAGRAESTRRTKLLLPRLTKVAREGAAGDFDNSGEQEGGDEMTRTDDPGDLQVRIQHEIVTTDPVQGT